MSWVLLKAYRINGPATVRAIPAVWIEVQDTKDTINGEGGALTSRFLHWAGENKIYPVIKSSTSGGGQYSGAYAPEDAERIVAWLKENGAVDAREETC